jgi:hypothetical protein
MNPSSHDAIEESLYAILMFLNLMGGSKLVIMMIWLQLVFLLQNNKILYMLQHRLHPLVCLVSHFFCLVVPLASTL